MKYQRQRQARWDRKQLRTMTTKIRQGDKDAFTDACYKVGKTPYAVMRELILSFAYDGKPKTATPDKDPLRAVLW